MPVVLARMAKNGVIGVSNHACALRNRGQNFAEVRLLGPVV